MMLELSQHKLKSYLREVYPVSHLSFLTIVKVVGGNIRCMRVFDTRLSFLPQNEMYLVAMQYSSEDLTCLFPSSH